MIGREGSSSAENGIALFSRFLQLARPEDIRVVTADREFIGEKWLSFLAEREIPFAIRLRKRRRLALGGPDGPALPAELFFRGLSVGQNRLLRERYISAICADVVGKRLAEGEAEDEYVILVTTASPDETPRLYRRRWEIKTLFAALKSRGFDLESTHLAKPERISKLIRLLSLAFVWSHLIGQQRAQRDGGPALKNHGYPAKSLFRYGLGHLQALVLNLPHGQQAFQRCINVLGHPSQFLSCS
jgi:hypothetical protein